MSKLQCTCGQVVVDQTIAPPYKATVISDAEVERLLRGVPARIAELFAQPTPEARRYWLTEQFGGRYPANATLEQAVHDLLTAAVFPVRRMLYECGSCGRLWLQAGPTTQRFRGYVPEVPETGALRPVSHIDLGDAHG